MRIRILPFNLMRIRIHKLNLNSSIKNGMEAKMFCMSVSHFNVSLLVTEADVQADAPLLQLAGNCARARPLPVRTQGLYICY